MIVHDSIEICKLRNCWRAIEPKKAYEDKLTLKYADQDTMMPAT